MNIQYRYKLVNSDEVKFINMTEAEYFDPISDQETYEEDSIPKHIDCRNYQPEIDKIFFEWDEIRISESIKSDTTIRTEYFAGGESQLIYRNDANGYELIIQSLLVSSNSVYVSRMSRSGRNEQWQNTSFCLGVNFESGGKEKWYNLKQDQLVNDIII